MIENKEALLIRATLLFLVVVYALRLEFWPVSHYPVFVTPVEPGKFTSYKLAFGYKNGSEIFPLLGPAAIRLDIYHEYEFDSRYEATRVGKLNLYAGLSFLRLNYEGRLDELGKLLDGVKTAYILREWHQKIKGEYKVIKSERLFEIDSDELFYQML